jgi:hypothetical protein
VTYTLDAKDGYVRRIIAVGQRMGITPRGIVIAIATGLVESGIKVYSNRAVPESMNLPYDAIGSDSRSVGIYQQQVVMGNGWWWGSAEECMSPERSSELFFARLAKKPYTEASTDRAAGAIAQSIQGSSFPDRYAQRMGEAQQLYNRLAASQNGGSSMPDWGITKTMHGYRTDTPANATGNSNGPRRETRFVVVHTEEGNSTATGLANYCNNNSVSYNLIVDNTDTVENVPIGEAPWAAADANGIGVHICFAGSRAAWTRDQWLARSAALDRAAKATAAACQQYNIPVAKIAAGTGWAPGAKGIAAHGDFGQRGGGHTDPGVFVWDDFIARVNRFMNTNTGGTPVSDTQLDRIEKKLDLVLDQLVGPGFGGWNQGGSRTLYDLTAAAAAKQGVAGARDTKAS